MSGKKNEEKENTLKEYVYYHLNKFFIDHIPSEGVKEMPDSSKSNCCAL